jgi:hypothetical protein
VHDPPASVLPDGVNATITNATSHLVDNDTLHSPTGSAQSDLTSTASHSPVADVVSGSSVGDTSHLQSDVTSLVHNVLPTGDVHPLF